MSKRAAFMRIVALCGLLTASFLACGSEPSQGVKPLPSGAVVQTMEIRSDRDLAYFRNVTWVTGDVHIHEFTVVDAALQLPYLEGIGGNFWVRELRGATSLELRRLEKIGGYLRIESVRDLQVVGPFDSLMDVGGSVVIEHCPALTTLSGLHRLREVRGSLIIQDNASLTSLKDLAAIKRIGFERPTEDDILSVEDGFPFMEQHTILGDKDWRETLGSFLISNNGLLHEFGDLEVTAVAGGFEVSDNGLATLAGLERLETVGTLMVLLGGRLSYLVGLNSLAHVRDIAILWTNIRNLVGLEGLTEISALFLADNDAMESFVGIDNVTAVTTGIGLFRMSTLVDFAGWDNLNYVGTIEAYGNDSLQSFYGLPHLTEIGSGGLKLEGNSSLVSFVGLESVTNIGGNLDIGGNLSDSNDETLAGNDSLTDFSGLDNLQHVGGNFDVVYNDALTGFTGLEKLTRVGGRIKISENAVLAGFDALVALDSMGGSELTITLNPDLCNNLALDFAAQLDVISGYTISGNAEC